MTYCSWETTNKIGKSYFYMTTRWGKWRKIYRNREFVRLFLKICCQKLPCRSGMLSKTISNHHTFDYYCWQFYLQPLNVIYEFIKKCAPYYRLSTKHPVLSFPSESQQHGGHLKCRWTAIHIHAACCQAPSLDCRWACRSRTAQRNGSRSSTQDEIYNHVALNRE